ncbi:hypothetical protein [Ekhidna sp.]|uniref:hypothetical protein n=1 Tax=Ekhidna sp. TaxID=2608089 RepID=UPI003CCB85F0
MSLLMNSMPVTDSREKSDNSDYVKASNTNDELTLSMSTVNTQTSPMTEELKKKKQSESPDLEELFMEVVRQKGEMEKLEMNRTSQNEFELEGISQMTLHSFLLKAEELGKTITYTRTLKVEITE